MVFKKAEVKDESKKELYSKRGKRAKRKGASYERLIADLFQKAFGVELKRTPQSGGFAKKSTLADDYRGDITIVNDRLKMKLHIECKNHKTWNLKKWLIQANSDCPKGRTPIVVFHEFNTSRDYVTLSLEDFLKLVPKDKVFEKRNFNND
ncbi:MAG: hypothetical protein J6F30_12760 [Cellulosilyticum sp.]|nr:hypothetical protein [Cellulosilyticum sp.]